MGAIDFRLQHKTQVRRKRRELAASIAGDAVNWDQSINNNVSDKRCCCLQQLRFTHKTTTTTTTTNISIGPLLININNTNKTDSLFGLLSTNSTYIILLQKLMM